MVDQLVSFIVVASVGLVCALTPLDLANEVVELGLANSELRAARDAADELLARAIWIIPTYEETTR